MKQSKKSARAGEMLSTGALNSLCQLVQGAPEEGPQDVTVHGRDAVVILFAEDYARLAPAAAQPSLHALLSSSPLRDLDFDHGSVRSPVRDVEL